MTTWIEGKYRETGNSINKTEITKIITNELETVIGDAPEELDTFEEVAEAITSNKEQIEVAKDKWTYFDYPKIKLTTTDGLPYTIRINTNKQVTVNSDEWYTIEDELISAVNMFSPINLADRTRLVSIDLSKFDTSTVLYAASMFYQCNSLTTIIGIENMDWSNNTVFDTMFAGCHSLPNLNLLKWNTSKAIYLTKMFAECRAMSNINLSTWDISKVINANGIVASCNLQELNLSNWNYISSKFYYTVSTGTIDKLIIRNAVINEYNGFGGSLIKELDLTGTTLNNTTFNGFRQGNNILEKFIYPTLESISGIADLFYNCTVLQYVDFSSLREVSGLVERCFINCPNTLVIKTTSAFRDFCIEHAEVMLLPTPLRDINSEQWIITD